jgi:hypothetical protein
MAWHSTLSEEIYLLLPFVLFWLPDQLIITLLVDVCISNLDNHGLQLLNQKSTCKKFLSPWYSWIADPTYVLAILLRRKTCLGLAYETWFLKQLSIVVVFSKQQTECCYNSKLHLLFLCLNPILFPNQSIWIQLFHWKVRWRWILKCAHYLLDAMPAAWATSSLLYIQEMADLCICYSLLVCSASPVCKI